MYMTTLPENRELPQYKYDRNGDSWFWLYLPYFTIGIVASWLYWDDASVPYWPVSFPLSCFVAAVWCTNRIRNERREHRRAWYQSQINLGIFTPPVLPRPDTKLQVRMVRTGLFVATVALYVIVALLLHVFGVYAGPPR